MSGPTDLTRGGRPTDPRQRLRTVELSLPLDLYDRLDALRAKHAPTLTVPDFLAQLLGPAAMGFAGHGGHRPGRAAGGRAVKLTLLGDGGLLYEAPRIQVVPPRRGHPLYIRVVYTRYLDGSRRKPSYVKRVYPGAQAFAIEGTPR